MSKTINQWFDEYGESHQNSTNKLFHFVCVPTIFFSFIGLLSLVSLPDIFGVNTKIDSVFFSLASLVIILSFLFYLRLSFSIAIGMIFVSIITLWLNYFIYKLDIIPLWLFSIIIFALAWVGQFYGHKVEGKKPSFFKDLQFLLIGPAWILSFIYKKLNIKY